MENKITTLKEIRRQTQGLDPRDGKFDEQYKRLAREALNCMEGINDMQERNWIEKGQEILKNVDENASPGEEGRDKALSYLKEAVHNVILREDNYRE